MINSFSFTMEESEMAKGKKTKKKNWKLRRQLRKTFGCLFMISALIVTAIPVQRMEAKGDGNNGWIEDKNLGFEDEWVYSSTTTIPDVISNMTGTPQAKPPVYQNETGDFRFVYVDRAGKWNSAEMDKSAVIVDFDSDRDLPGGKLTIPISMDAYIKYTDTGSDIGSYAAANKMGYPLYYKKMTTTTRQVQGNDPVLSLQDGELSWETPIETRATAGFEGFLPCTPSSKGTWCPGGVDIELYYYDDSTRNGIPDAAALADDTNAKWKQVSDDKNGRIVGAPVRYIGDYYAVYENNDWNVKSSTAQHSVFGGLAEGQAASNISDLTFAVDTAGSSPLVGIGNYAFLGCTSIRRVAFGNGLRAFGNYAFANCRQLRTVTMPDNTALDTLGAYAFLNCDSLEAFTIPVALQKIGDFCFKNCINMTSVTITEAADGSGVNLHTIGYRAFENCSKLESLTLPLSYNGKEGNSTKGGIGDGGNVFHLSTVKGCTALKYIKTFSQTIQFVSDALADTKKGGYNDGKGLVDGDYSFEAFKQDVGSGFYFEGPGYRSGSKTQTHNVANVNHICFKYLDEDRYEIVEEGKSENATAPDVGLVYQVDHNGNLIEFRIEELATGETSAKHVPEIIMPEVIGQFGIGAIMAKSFNNNCYIEKVVIPGSVKTIGDGAFKGSHNLKHIVFSNAAAIESIGTDAFATQVIDRLHGTPSAPNTCNESDFLGADNTPFLSFTGAIEKDDGTNTIPFTYAMKSSSRINAGQQQRAFITYYSGIPTNLTVKYNPETAKSELLYFPTMKDLREGFQVTQDECEGAYQPQGSSKYYRFPYITDELADRVTKDIANGTMSDELRSLVNGVENIVIPTGVQSIKEGLFSGLTTNGYIIGALKQKVDENGDPLTTPRLDESGNEIKDDEGNVITDPVMIPAENARPTGDYKAPASDVQSITTKSVATLEPYTFARMPELTRAYVNGAAAIGNYAFDECPKLEYAEVGSATSELGLRPFSGCDALAQVNFDSNPSFTEENGVIYGVDANGTKTKIVQCLPGRGKVVGSMGVGPDELEGIKEVAEEAFMDCPSIRQVDLSSSVITTVPKRCFAESENLNNVILPNTIKTILDGAFWNTKGLFQVTIPGSIASIANDAFADVDKDEETGEYLLPPKTERSSGFEFVTPAGSNADAYATIYKYITTTENPAMRGTVEITLMDAVDMDNRVQYDVKRILTGDNLELTVLDIPDHTADGYEFSHWQPDPASINPIFVPREIWAMYKPIGENVYTVRFFDIDKNEMTEYTQQVVEGKNAVPPTRDVMAVEGKVFTGWDRDYTNITNNMDIYAQYSSREEGKYYVTFWTDSEMTTMIGKVQEVDEGDSAIEPAHPTKEGYTFAGWSSSGWQNVTKDWDIFAVYAQGGADDPNKPDNPNDPNKPNDPNAGGNDKKDDNKDKDKDDDSVSENAVKYKVVVNGGSGSGDYTAGTIVPINAYARADGTVFDKWTSSSNGVGFVNQTAISTTFTMPANNVEITANFKKDTSSVSGNSRSARRNATTTVDVTKSGISNTGLASANVNGTSDNFVVKITDDAQATAAVIAALEGKYGDLSNIAYLPMDISLYDSTGQTKITDVSGISVDITLPLPDGLIQYAGNNKAASVVNGRLEDLGTRFTTIDGIPCVQFTATHFSPYTIYVDKGNLTEGLIDATPKTGDPIHPKWFLAMGLACISIILFCKKDKRQPNVKAA